MLMSDAEQDPESDARDTVRYWIDTVANNDPEIAQLRDELASEPDSDTNTDTEPVSEVQISQEPDAAVVDPDTDQIDEDAALVRLKSLISTVR
jgi:hypothetical protein